MEPTKKVVMAGEPGGYTETTEEVLCSVELGATAKGETQIKSVKVYSTTSQQAALEALETLTWLKDQLALIDQLDGEYKDVTE